MRAFEVYLNGKKLCLAGIGNDGVLTTIVNWVARKGRGDLFLEVGGLVSSADEHVAWINQKPLRVGDQLRIKLVETSSVDEPTKRHRTDPAEQLKSKKRYVRMMAKELGWKIQARSK
ncbi:MAG: hypothetical protein LAO24_12855 [Acidobacteriia bacterium]|nr:hypothetical protein [Terriglobia bacterium]